MTIYLEKNASNVCLFTLNESKKLANPNLILQVVSKATNKSKLMWLLDDVSLQPVRYNKYIIDEVVLADEDLVDQKIYLPTGQYDFYVWETNMGTLTLTNAAGVIESGMIEVVGVDEPIKAFTGQNVKVTYKK